MGIDGTTFGKVDKAAPTGTTITCFTCHNETTEDITSVVFPSGIKITGFEREAHCIRCHQGMSSYEAVESAITDLGLEDEEFPSENLTFIDSHSISAATLFGTEVQGAYEYQEKTYVGRFLRGDDFFSCIQCHNEHTLGLQPDTCVDCHTFDGTEIKDIRVNKTDFDGDGDIHVGIAYEIESFEQRLLEAIQDYANNVIGISIGFNPQIYPYFFIDTNDDGNVDQEEAVFVNQYPTWTPRLLRAAYNFNYSSHDQGAYAHNSYYILQVLYDSLEDIGGDVSTMQRP
jgi:hypothetical protein